jgi:hypothetical protein
VPSHRILRGGAYIHGIYALIIDVTAGLGGSRSGNVPCPCWRFRARTLNLPTLLMVFAQTCGLG